ncbi:acyl-CoA N-acyltransferase [Metschnikowia bicuspidata var. bicuspidata NRRL YB-4993]|uniref:Glucosamine 6-phosphate N-acetyltransferase n=1 Tax=Metschnikowia bicuspidata var. bicuspidata NRRL YB-4993 TaxID=869754 RepID=A0A1A0H7P6_9ASCO|nr:acyl-CoA N-acyltransferase [Metschnikowia bicuspidata var. bicuspidata NRRL YB-4993]OBA20005.1 acyl-CoA N-acyltransferase [Metschnikowia bicuspidata var. bicuspidata NRRL YB-4993]
MALPQGYKVRAVQANDHKQYMATLSVLTSVGDVTEMKFLELVRHWDKYSEIYYPKVIVDSNDCVVATGMLFIEQKLIHGCGRVGHIEDIAVAKSQQGLKVGNMLIQHLSKIAEEAGCYKVILDCSKSNVGFYEKCGYKDAGIEMCKRYD